MVSLPGWHREREVALGKVQSLVPLVLPHAQGSRHHPCCNHAARSDFAKAEVT